MPSSSEKKNFEDEILCSYVPTYDPTGGANLDPWSIILTLSQTSPGFYLSAIQAFLKTLWEKEKLLETSNLSFSRSVFFPFWELSPIFIKFEIVICKPFQFGSVRHLLFGKGLRNLVEVY